MPLSEREKEALDLVKEKDFYAGVSALIIAALAPAKPAKEIAEIVDSIYKDLEEYYDE